MIKNTSQLLSALAWCSVFCESWMLLTRRIPSDLLAWGLWLFFLAVAILSAIASIEKVQR